MTRSRYLIALGGNMRHVRHGAPAKVLRAALTELAGAGMTVEKCALAISSAPLGPSRRRYANTAAVIETTQAPPALLATLKRIERAFGRRAGGPRWSARVLDLDIVLWSGGTWSSPGLTIPHRAFRERPFVLNPAARIAPTWRDPLTGLTMRQLAVRLARPMPTLDQRQSAP